MFLEKFRTSTGKKTVMPFIVFLEKQKLIKPNGRPLGAHYMHFGENVAQCRINS